MNKWVWLCSTKTLFINRENRPDLVCSTDQLLVWRLTLTGEGLWGKHMQSLKWGWGLSQAELAEERKAFLGGIWLGPSDLCVLGSERREGVKHGQEDASLKGQRNSGLGINSESIVEAGTHIGGTWWGQGYLFHSCCARWTKEWTS